MSIIVLRCKKCGHEVELWVPLYGQREERMKEVPCKECGENIWEIRPATFAWHWGEKIKTKE